MVECKCKLVECKCKLLECKCNLVECKCNLVECKCKLVECTTTKELFNLENKEWVKLPIDFDASQDYKLWKIFYDWNLYKHFYKFWVPLPLFSVPL